MVPIYILIPAAVLSMYSSICCAQGMVIQKPVFVVHPQDRTINIGEDIPSVLFTCTAVNVSTGELDYFINGCSLSNTTCNNQSKRFFNQPLIDTVIVSGMTGYMRILTLKNDLTENNINALISLYNYAEIYCLVDNDDTKLRKMSNTSILIFQEEEDPMLSPSPTYTVTSTMSSSHPLSTSSSPSSGVIGSTSVESPTLSSSPTDSTPRGGSRGPLDNGANAGTVIAAVVIGIMLVIVGIVILVLVICLKRGHEDNIKLKNLLKNIQDDSAIPLVSKHPMVPGTYTPELPETGQPTYQDPSYIEREPPPTGDMYALPDMSSKRKPRPQQPELATYQDPNTIQRTQVPTGDFYAMPEKKSPNKTAQSGGLTYADLDTHLFKSPQPSEPLIPDSQVPYSDVSH